MLNLKQKLCQSSENKLVPHLPSWQGYTDCFLEFMRNNTGSFHAKRLNCDSRCYSEVILKKKKKKKKKKRKTEKVES